MTVTAMIEVAVAAAILAGGVLAYRRGENQGAVLLFVVAVILLIHGLGLMHYRPSPAELNQ